MAQLSSSLGTRQTVGNIWERARNNTQCQLLPQSGVQPLFPMSHTGIDWCWEGLARETVPMCWEGLSPCTLFLQPNGEYRRPTFKCVVKRLRFQGDCEFNYCVLGPPHVCNTLIANREKHSHSHLLHPRIYMWAYGIRFQI